MAKKNSNLNAAREAKNNEFYTRLEDIENELRNYKEHFKGKKIVCPCDESEWTNFCIHFNMNREVYGFKKLSCIGYRENRPAEVHTIEATDNGWEVRNEVLIGNGDFRNLDTQKIIEDGDVVVTNPPFSLFREFVDLLIKMDKKFLIIGSQNAINYKEVFPLIRDNKMWLGYTNPSAFYDKQNDMAIKKFGNICWYTNLTILKREEWLDTGIDFKYGTKKGWYQKYDNYDAINIDKVSQIPMDYEGVMGVPITFLDKYNPKQFQIIGRLASAGWNAEQIGIPKTWDNKEARGVVNGKVVYSRILIKKK